MELQFFIISFLCSNEYSFSNLFRIESAKKTECIVMGGTGMIRCLLVLLLKAVPNTLVGNISKNLQYNTAEGNGLVCMFSKVYHLHLMELSWIKHHSYCQNGKDDIL